MGLITPALPAQEAVANGVALLDSERADNWALQIDRYLFDINNGWACVLGQLYEGFYRGCKILGSPTIGDDLDQTFRNWAQHYGFIGAQWEDPEEEGHDIPPVWQELQDEWLKILTERQLAEVPA